MRFDVEISSSDSMAIYIEKTSKVRSSENRVGVSRGYGGGASYSMGSYQLCLTSLPVPYVTYKTGMHQLKFKFGVSGHAG